MVSTVGAGLLVWVVAGFTMTRIAGAAAGELVVQAWVVAVLVSAGFVSLLENWAPRLRSHAWTLLAVAAVVGVMSRLVSAGTVAGDVTTVAACWAAGAAATWVIMNASTDLIAWRMLDFAHSAAVTFDAAGVGFQPEYGRGGTVHLSWPEVSAVSIQLGPTRRPGPCVTPTPERAGHVVSAVAAGRVPHPGVRHTGGGPPPPRARTRARHAGPHAPPVDRRPPRPGAAS